VAGEGFGRAPMRGGVQPRALPEGPSDVARLWSQARSAKTSGARRMQIAHWQPEPVGSETVGFTAGLVLDSTQRDGEPWLELGVGTALLCEPQRGVAERAVAADEVVAMRQPVGSRLDPRLRTGGPAARADIRRANP